MHLFGCCPRCGRWFLCDGWIGVHGPEPWCPVCGQAPGRMEYRRTLDGSTLAGARPAPPHGR